MMAIFLIFVIIAQFFSCNIAHANEVVVEISKARIKTTTFAIECCDEKLKTSLAEKLIWTNRFKSGINPDLLIKITKANEQAKVEVIDGATNKIIRCFVIQCIGNYLNKIADNVYSTWIGEDGLFSTSIIFAQSINANLSMLMMQQYGTDNIAHISSPISYLTDLIFSNGNILISKFYPKTRGFGIFGYNRNAKKFFNILTIKNSSAFAPAIFNNKLYISASASGTTGLYAVNGLYQTFANFGKFEQHESVAIISKMPNKIATSVSINENGLVFCANFQNLPAVFFIQNLDNCAQMKKISNDSSACYYSPVLHGKQIAAIKTQNKMFHLVIMDFYGNEKILLSKYYVGKPAWSPCGNWLAVSCRNYNQKNVIILIHKSGRYLQTLRTQSAAHPIWIEK